MSDNFSIKSYKGSYDVFVGKESFLEIKRFPTDKTQFLIDKNVFEIYSQKFKELGDKRNIVLIDAHESNKNLDRMSGIVEKLNQNGIKRDHLLVAIGGGITQDITCFLASTLFRGMKWCFVPTTLLAQADSCIGSKSSINVGQFKNLMGTFYPPQKIILDTDFLKTLDRNDIYSGIGEILKVHMIKGIVDFEHCLSQYDNMINDWDILKSFILDALKIKKEIIEIDEFDKDIRNIMNYGHSFGHAIESATNFKIPHGIAVTIGMDMANYYSCKLGRIGQSSFISWHKGLFKNYKKFSGEQISLEAFILAISKDKKNIGSSLSLILCKSGGGVEKVSVDNDDLFFQTVDYFFKEVFCSPEVC